MALTPINGTSGTDKLVGTADPDLINGLAGNDDMEGAAGTDTAVFAGLHAEYDIATVNGVTFIKDRAKRDTAGDGNDKTTNVERLQFADKTVLLAENKGVTANADAVSGTEDAPIVIAASTLLANDSDLDGDDLAITAVGGATHGRVELSEDGQTITFTPDPDYFGAAQFTYTVRDVIPGAPSEFLTAQGTVDLSIADAPDLTSHFYTTGVIGTTIDFFDPAQTDYIAGGINNPFDGGHFEQRGVLEFNVGSVERVSAARLTADFWNNYYNLPNTLNVYAYNGDGSVSMADDDVGTLVATVTVTGEQTLRPFDLPLDTEIVNGLLAQPGDWLGFNFRVADELGQNGFAIGYNEAPTVLDLVF